MERPIRVLCVCTHNRTRSVMMGALLHHAGQAAARTPRVDVRTAGFEQEEMPPTSPTVELLARRGIDVSEHRSHRLTSNDILTADLILTSEVRHVINITSQEPEAFSKVFTLPEFVGWIGGHQAPDSDLSALLAAIDARRSRGLEYLKGDVAEVADPTGRSMTEWRRRLQELDNLTASVHRALTTVV